MSATTSDSETDYPFHTTAESDDEFDVDQPHVGVAFVAGTGRFYEFTDPSTHDDYERLRDPRTGKTIVSDGPLDHTVTQVMGGHVRALVPADEWASFREMYVDADEDRTDEWERQWKELHKAETYKPA